jgi:hypothetical protein
MAASSSVLGRRIADRVPDAWPGKGPLIARAAELAMSIPAITGIDVVIDPGGRSAVDVAAQVRALLSDHDLIPAVDE